MSASIPFSPHARTMLRSTRTFWGAVLVALFILFACLATGSSSGWLALAVPLALIGVPLLATGIMAGRRASAFNRADHAFSLAINGQLANLAGSPHSSAFDADSTCAKVTGATVVELERHFDQDTSGAIVGTLTHSMRMFGHSAGLGMGRIFDSGALLTGNVTTMRGFMNGVSNAQLGMSGTTRSNLMGDALFSVLEFTGRDGQPDTMRLISMSGPAATQWMGDLVMGASVSLGGAATHAGQAVASWVDLLVANFTPRDVSYATDRLKAMERNKEMTLPVAAGQLVGRNAMLATAIQFSNGTVTRLFPHRFPAMLGNCIGQAAKESLSSPAAPGLEAMGPGGPALP